MKRSQQINFFTLCVHSTQSPLFLVKRYIFKMGHKYKFGFYKSLNNFPKQLDTVVFKYWTTLNYLKLRINTDLWVFMVTEEEALAAHTILYKTMQSVDKNIEYHQTFPLNFWLID